MPDKVIDNTSAATVNVDGFSMPNLDSLNPGVSEKQLSDTNPLQVNNTTEQNGHRMPNLDNVNPIVDPKEVDINKENNQVTNVHPFELGAEMNKWLAPAYQHAQKGVDDLQASLAGSKLIEGDGEGYANVEAQLSANSHVKPLPADTPEWASHVADIMSPILESAPSLGEIAKQAIIPTTAGAATGSFIPGVGTIAGGLIAADVSSSVTTGRLAAGQLYMQLRREGAPHDVAKTAAISAGAIVGGLQLGQGWLLAGLGKGAIGLATKNPEVSKFLTSYIAKYAGHMIGSIGIAEAQTAATIATEAITAHVTNNPQLSPKNILNRFGETAMQMAVLHPTMASVGFLGTKAVKTVHGVILPKTLAGGMKAYANTLELPGANLSAHLDNEGQKAAEGLSEGSEKTPEQAKEEAIANALNNIFPQEELKTEIAKVDTRTKAEIERDDNLAQLRRDVNITQSKKAAALKLLRGAIAATRLLPKEQRIEHEIEVNNLRDKVKDLDATQKEIEKKETELETEYSTIEAKRLEKVIDKTEPPNKNGLSNSQLARNSKIQKVLDKVRFYFHDQNAANTIVQEYETVEASGGKPDLELQEEYAAASLVNNVKGRNAKGLRKLKIEIQEAYTEGRKGRLLELAEEAEDRKNFLDRFENGLQGNTPISAHTNEPEKPRFHIPYFGRSLTNWFGNYTQHNQTILSEAPTLAERNKLVGEIEVRDYVDERETNHAGNMEKLYSSLAEKTKTSKYAVKELIRKGAKTKITINFWEPSEPDSKIFKESKTTISVNKAIEILGQLENEKAAKALVEGNGFVEPNAIWELEAIENTKSEIENKLEEIDPLYLDFVEAYQKAYKRLHAILSKAVEEDTGYPLPNEANYFGPMLHAKNDKRTVEGMTSEEFEQGLKSPGLNGNAIKNRNLGHTKSRTGDKTALIVGDVNDTFSTYSRLSENWLSFRRLVKQRIAPLHGSVKVNTIIKRKFGNETHKSWKQRTKDVLYGEVNDKNTLERFLDALIFKNIPFALLHGKPWMFPMHVLATGNIFFYLPPASTIKGLAKFWSDPINNAKKMTSSIQYKRRHSGHDIETATNTQFSEKMQHPAMTVYEHAGMAATVYGIKAEIISMFVAYEHYKNDLKMPEVEAMKKAGDLVNRTQVSGGVDLRSPLNRSLIGRLFGAYQGQVIKMAQQVAIDADFYMRNKTRESALTLFSSVAAAAYTAFIFESGKALYRYMTASSDAERKRAQFDMITSPALAVFAFMNLPFVKDGVQDALVFAANNLDKAADGTGGMKVAETSGLLDLGGKALYNLYMDAQAQQNDPNWIDTHQLKVLENINALASFVIKSPFGSYLHHQERMERKEKYDSSESGL